MKALVGLLLALGIGVLIGCLLSTSRFLEEATGPVLTLIQVTPFVAYIASVQIWLGLDNRRPALFIATLVCVPAFTFATVSRTERACPCAVSTTITSTPRSTSAATRSITSGDAPTAAATRSRPRSSFVAFG